MEFVNPDSSASNLKLHHELFCIWTLVHLHNNEKSFVESLACKFEFVSFAIIAAIRLPVQVQYFSTGTKKTVKQMFQCVLKSKSFEKNLVWFGKLFEKRKSENNSS